VLDQARSRIGLREQPDGSNRVAGITDWYGMVGPWCAMFVSRCFYDAGLPLPASTPKGFAWTPSGVAWFKQQGRWHDGSAGIAAGDVVFFDFQTGDVHPVDHVGIVESVNADGSFNTIEGNTSNQVMRHRRNACKGYGRPPWIFTVPQPSNPEEFTVDADARKAFDDIIRRLDNDHLPIARDTNAWVKAKANGAPADLAAAIAALGTDVARKVADELAKRLAS
jgi:hypothetical protein